MFNFKYSEIYKELFNEKYRLLVVYGGRGSGKSHAVARRLLIAANQKKCRILCTREVQRSISESVHKLLSDLIIEENLPFTVNKTSIYSNVNGSEFIFHGLRDDTARSIKSMEGIDYCWVDEAQHVSRDNFNILLPTIRKENSQIFMTFNRTEISDPVYELFVESKRKDTLVIFANYYDNPFCTQTIINDAAISKKLNYNEYLHVYEGLPMKDGGWNALPTEKVMKAMERNIENPEGPVRMGIDVARGGGDRTSIFVTKGLKVIDWWHTAESLEIEELKTKAIDMLYGKKVDMIRCDDTGLGWGLTESLEKHFGKSKVHGINFASKEGIDRSIYPDFMSYMYFQFLENMIDEVDLPYDTGLLKELCGRKYHLKNTLKQRQVESKEDYKKRLKRSPDHADALLLCFVGKPKVGLDYFIV